MTPPASRPPQTPEPVDGLAAVGCRQFRGGAWRDIEDAMAPEEQVSVVVEGLEPRTLWAHPHDLETLALGHARMELAYGAGRPVLAGRQGNVFHVKLVPGPGAGQPACFPRPLAADEVLAAMEALFGGAGLWAETGCFHRAGLYDPLARRFAALAEDIGRHNCMDRLAGRLLASGEDAGGLALFVSARITASMCLKARALGVQVAVSRSAVTTAALELARKGDLTLLGFCREGRFTVFHDPQGRIAP